MVNSRELEVSVPQAGQPESQCREEGKKCPPHCNPQPVLGVLPVASKVQTLGPWNGGAQES